MTVATRIDDPAPVSAGPALPSAPVDNPATSVRRHDSLIVALIVLTQAVVYFRLAGRSFFFADDLQWFRFAQEQPLTVEYLRFSAFGHFIPLVHLTNSAMVRFAPFDYGVARIVMAGTWSAACWAAFAVARGLGAPRAVRLAVPAVLAGSVVALNALPWWSAVICLFTSTAANLVVFHQALRWWRHRRVRNLVGAAAAYLVACMFWEKSLLTGLWLVAFVYLLVDTEGTWRDLPRRVWRDRALWLTLGGVGLVYLVEYLSGGYATESGDPASVGEVVPFLRVAWFEGLWPAVVGMSSAVNPIAGSKATAVVLGQLAFVAIVLLLARRNRSAAIRFSAFVAFVFVVNMSIVGRARIGFGGSDVGRDLRYHFDNLYLVVLAVAAAAAFPVHGRRVVGRRVLDRRSRALSALPAVVAGAVALVLVTTVVRAGPVIESSPGVGARAYFANVNASIDELAPDGQTIELLDTELPQWLINPGLHPYSLASRVLPQLPGVDVAFTSADDEPLILGLDGRIVRGAFQPTVDVAAGTCVGPGSVSVDLAPPVPLPATQRAFRLDYRASAPAAVTLETTDGAQPLFRAHDPAQLLDPSLGHFTTALRATAITDAVLRVETAGELCIDRAQFGSMVPTG